MSRRYWTREDEELLRQFYPDWPTDWLAPHLGRSTRQLYQKARVLGLAKSAAYRAACLKACGAAFGESGKAHRFPKGHMPANKGLRRPGWASGRMAETQFKKGEMRGAAQHNYVPIGTEKYDTKRKNVVRKVTDDPSLKPIMRWRPVSVLVWESANGPVPRGHIVVFRRGMKTLVSAEITVDRLELITLAENMRRNTVHNLPPELVRVVQLRGAVVRQIHRKEKKRGNDQ